MKYRYQLGSKSVNLKGQRSVRFPLAAWSSSIASKRDLKLPAPNPYSNFISPLLMPADSVLTGHQRGDVQDETYAVIVSFDDFKEECGSILHGLGEDLEQVAIVIKVNQYPEPLELENFVSTHIVVCESENSLPHRDLRLL